MKIRLVGAELFHGDRHVKPNSRILQFYKHAQNPIHNATSCPPLQTGCDLMESAQLF